MAFKHFGITNYVLQPGERRTTDETGVVTTEQTYIGPSSVDHGFTVCKKLDAVGYIYSVQEEVLEGGLTQVVVVSKDLGKMKEVYQKTKEWTRQYKSTIVYGEGYITYKGWWVLVPSITVRCTRHSRSEYSSGSLPHGGGSAPNYALSGGVVTAGAWVCVSASCTNTGDSEVGWIQEIEERWEVEYTATSV